MSDPRIAQLETRVASLLAEVSRLRVQVHVSGGDSLHVVYTNDTIDAGTSRYVPDSLEIAASMGLEIAAGSTLEIG